MNYLDFIYAILKNARCNNVDTSTMTIHQNVAKSQCSADKNCKGIHSTESSDCNFSITTNYKACSSFDITAMASSGCVQEKITTSCE